MLERWLYPNCSLIWIVFVSCNLYHEFPSHVCQCDVAGNFLIQSATKNGAHEFPNKNKICSKYAGRGHACKVCEMGDRPEKHKFLNCDGNYITTAKSYLKEKE